MTKIREGYKETEIGVIPEDWEVDIFENICIPNGLVRGPFGGALKKEYFVKYGYKVYEQKNAINKNSSIGGYYIDETKFNDLKRFEVKEKDFIVSCSGTIGKIYQIPRNYEKGIINQALLKITLDHSKVNDSYFYNYFEWEGFQKKIIDNTQGGAMKNLVGMDIIKKTMFSVPPLPEQKRIAEILSTTDAHIEKLDRIIEDYQLLKKGMMKKLLTEGIGHTEFKETEIGRIPKEWEVVKLSQVADAEKINSFIDGDWIEKEHITDAGIRLIQTGNIGVGYYIEKEEKKFIFERSFNDLNCKEVYPNDILICRMAEPTGRSCIIPNLNSRMITSVDCVILRVNESYYDNHFVNHYINSEESLKYSYQNQQGTTRKRITRKKLGELKIPVPKLEEQLKISSILNEIDQRIELLRTEVKDFKNFKKSMMEQLLTGKIRTIYLQSGGVI